MAKQKNAAQNSSKAVSVKPIMKWAGGKSQMLKDILPLVPEYRGKYI